MFAISTLECNTQSIQKLYQSTQTDSQECTLIVLLPHLLSSSTPWASPCGGQGRRSGWCSYPTPGLGQDAANISVQAHKHSTGGAERRSELDGAMCSKARDYWEEMGNVKCICCVVTAFSEHGRQFTISMAVGERSRLDLGKWPLLCCSSCAWYFLGNWYFQGFQQWERTY